MIINKLFLYNYNKNYRLLLNSTILLRCMSTNSIINNTVITKPNTTHLERTYNQYRHNYIFDTTIQQINQVTPTVKHIQLYVNGIDIYNNDNIEYCNQYNIDIHKLNNINLEYSSGQWVDMYIQPVDIVGGYSITNPYNNYILTNCIDLHIKYSTHKPAYYIHTQARINDHVNIRIGGEFIYTHDVHNSIHTKNVIFIAGGIGVNTVYNMLCTRIDVLNKLYNIHHSHSHSDSDRDNNNDNNNDHDNDNNNSLLIPHTTFLYTAKTYDELLFHNNILQYQQLYNKYITYEYSCTQQHNGKRIDIQQIIKHIQHDNIHNTIFYICGQPYMTDSIVQQLTQYGINHNNIKYEKWW